MFESICSGMAGATLVEEQGRLHRRPKLLASFIRHAALHTCSRMESGQFRRVQ